MKAKTKRTALTLLTKMFLKLSKFTNQNGPVHFFRFFREKNAVAISKNVFLIYCNTKMTNLSTEEWAALKRCCYQSGQQRRRGSCLADRPLPTRSFRQLSNTSFYAKVNRDLTSTNQKTVKKTIQDLTDKQELPVTAKNLIVTTPTTSSMSLNLKFTNRTTLADQLFLLVVSLLNVFLAFWTGYGAHR